MIKKQWMRAGVGVCTATALVVGAGLAFAPAANAATPDPTMTSSGLLDTVAGTVGGVVTTVGGVVGGVLTPNPTASSPITVGTSNGTITVGVGSTTVGVGAGSGTVNVGVSGAAGTGVGVVLGSSSTGTTIGGTVTTPITAPTGGTSTSTGSSTGTSTSTNTSTSTTSSTNTSTGTTGGTSTGTAQPILLTSLTATPSAQTVYPAKDGYRDSVAFQLKGATTDGQQHAASGTATLTFGSSTVTSWTIAATDDRFTWNGLKGGKVVPGRYLFTAKIGDTAGTVVTTTASVDVSAKKLASATHTLSSKAVSGTHKMAAKPLSGLSKGAVKLKVTSVASGVKGKQYLVFKHGAKKIKVLIRNGKHTSKAVTIPKSFTTYTISHTWKKHTVKIKSLKYKYSYKALK